jgi:hypothetical protein
MGRSNSWSMGDWRIVEHGEIKFSRSRYTNCSISFWWNYISTAVTGATESYNGTAWTSSPNSLNTARRALGGAGVNTAALGFGGFSTVNTGVNESWNGTSWTELGDLNTARREIGGCGATNTAALAFGGILHPCKIR